MSSDAADALGWDPYYGWGAIDAAGALAILDQVDGDYSKYTVTYHNNGADVATSTVPVDNAGYHPSAASVASPGYSPLGYYANSKVTVLAPTAAGGNLAKAHWTFQGWATTAGGPVVYTAGHEFAITANVNLYPVWLEDPTYTVTYHNTGADVATSTAPTDPASPYYAYETVAVLAPRAGNPAGNLAKANCAFLGWDTNSAAATVVYEPGATLAITANIDLYPVWKDSYDGAIITIASHKAPNQLLAIPGKAPTAGVQTVLGTKNNTAGQRFRLTLVDTNTYTITNISSGLVLDIYGGGIRDGAAVIQWTYKGSDNQLWHLLPNANGSVSIVSKADDSYCLDMTGGQTVNGTKIIIWKYTAGKINQQWDFTQITQTIPDGLYNIRTMGVGNRSLDVYGNSTKPGAEMLLWDFGGPAKVNQQFRVTYQPTTGFYAISCHSGLSVDVYGGSMTAGAQVIQWTFKTGNNLNQQWSIADNGLGNASYWIIGAQSGLALDVYGGNVANNGRIITWTYHGRANQQWSFTKLSA
jgi:hypothetical protein